LIHVSNNIVRRTRPNQVFQQLVEVCSERGGGLVVVTHNPQLARLLGRRLTLADGRLAEAD
jgi:predicted ABC-type transport system involved in lysophospholipase L1 biosynthesis ATPase subunit